MSSEREVAIITGASSGIGRAVAEEMAGPGTAITLVARREEKLREVANAVENQGGTAKVESRDVRDTEGMEETVRNTVDEFGRLDYVIANAGVSWKTEAHDFDRESVLETFRINVNGVLNLFGPALDVLLDQGEGQLVAVSSMASFHGLPGKAAYCASKAALSRIAESFRFDLTDESVGVTTIYPGYVETPMTEHYPEGELSFVVPVDEAAQKIIKAMKNNEKRCIFPWQMAILARMMEMLPSGLVDWMLPKIAAPMTEAAPTGPSSGE